MSFNAHEFGRRLLKARLEAGLIQGDLASRLGMTHAAISAWEQGKKRIYLDTAVRLCEVLGVSLDQLVGLADEASPESPLSRRQAAILGVAEALVSDPEATWARLRHPTVAPEVPDGEPVVLFQPLDDSACMIVKDGDREHRYEVSPDQLRELIEKYLGTKRIGGK